MEHDSSRIKMTCIKKISDVIENKRQSFFGTWLRMTITQIDKEDITLGTKAKLFYFFWIRQRHKYAEELQLNRITQNIFWIVFNRKMTKGRLSSARGYAWITTDWQRRYNSESSKPTFLLLMDCTETLLKNYSLTE